MVAKLSEKINIIERGIDREREKKGIWEGEKKGDMRRRESEIEWYRETIRRCRRTEKYDRKTGPL